jgi:hypothetical protein
MQNRRVWRAVLLFDVYPHVCTFNGQAVVPFAVNVAPKRPVVLISTALRVNAQQPPCASAAMGSTLERLLLGRTLLCSLLCCFLFEHTASPTFPR